VKRQWRVVSGEWREKKSRRPGLVWRQDAEIEGRSLAMLGMTAVFWRDGDGVGRIDRRSGEWFVASGERRKVGASG
jgi:hypothetical protein